MQRTALEYADVHHSFQMSTVNGVKKTVRFSVNLSYQIIPVMSKTKKSFSFEDDLLPKVKSITQEILNSKSKAKYEYVVGANERKFKEEIKREILEALNRIDKDRFQFKTCKITINGPVVKAVKESPGKESKSSTALVTEKTKIVAAENTKPAESVRAPASMEELLAAGKIDDFCKMQNAVVLLMKKYLELEQRCGQQEQQIAYLADRLRKVEEVQETTAVVIPNKLLEPESPTRDFSRRG